MRMWKLSQWLEAGGVCMWRRGEREGGGTASAGVQPRSAALLHHAPWPRCCLCLPYCQSRLHTNSSVGMDVASITWQWQLPTRPLGHHQRSLDHTWPLASSPSPRLRQREPAAHLLSLRMLVCNRTRPDDHDGPVPRCQGARGPGGNKAPPAERPGSRTGHR